MVEKRARHLVVLEARPGIGREKAHAGPCIAEVNGERFDPYGSRKAKRLRQQLLVAFAKATLANDGDTAAATAIRGQIVPAIRADKAARGLDRETSPGRLSHPTLVSPEGAAETVRARPIRYWAGKLRQPRNQKGSHLRGHIGAVGRNDLGQLKLGDPGQARDNRGDLVGSEHSAIGNDCRRACTRAVAPPGLREIARRDYHDVSSGQPLGQA